MSKSTYAGPEAVPGEARIQGEYEEHHKDAEHHIIGLPVYYRVFASLMVLLLITVGAAEFDLAHIWGPANILIALAIAAAKAVLIILFFMHVKYSSRLVWIFVATAYLFLAIMFAFASADFLSRGWLPTPGK